MRKRDIVGTIIFILLFAYGVLITLAYMGANMEIDSFNEKVDSQEVISKCMDQAYQEYSSDWNRYCELNGIKIVNGSCSIPVEQKDKFDNILLRQRELCVSRYKDLN